MIRHSMQTINKNYTTPSKHQKKTKMQWKEKWEFFLPFFSFPLLSLILCAFFVSILQHHNKWNTIGSRKYICAKKTGQKIWHYDMTGGRTRDIWLLGLKEDMKAIDFPSGDFYFLCGQKTWSKKITIVSLVWMHVYLYSIHMMSQIEIPYSIIRMNFSC
jgi:hypothetical protein